MGGERRGRVSPEVKQAARAMRKEMTPAERELWNWLRGWKIAGGVRFRRQFPVDRFILDFFCRTHRLCIEVDGGVHDEQPERDAARDAVLAAMGIRTLRFRNEEVLRDPRTVLRRIEREILSAPNPKSPLPPGEGGEPKRAG